MTDRVTPRSKVDAPDYAKPTSRPKATGLSNSVVEGAPKRAKAASSCVRCSQTLPNTKATSQVGQLSEKTRTRFRAS